MYVIRWIDKELIDAFFRWVSRMNISYTLENPLAAIQYCDFQVLMHENDWEIFYDTFRVKSR